MYVDIAPCHPVLYCWYELIRASLSEGGSVITALRSVWLTVEAEELTSH